MIRTLVFIRETLQLNKRYCCGLHNFIPRAADSHEKITYVPTVHMKPDDGQYFLKLVWFLVKHTGKKQPNMYI